jgi:chromosome segregation protein
VGEIERAGKAETELAEQLEALGVRVDEAIAAAEAVGEKVLAARHRSQAIERDWHSLEVAKRELEVKRENLEDRAREELMLDLAWEHAEYRALIDSGGVVPVDVERAEAEIGTLRDAIKSLGSVNLDSIHEETDLSDQHVKLRAQVEDLDTARGQLLELIDRLNTLSRERFKDVFERIREAFGAENGMFRKLFGGGRAEVRLMPLVKEINGEKVVTDETDLLESGIEIIAKPPGKEPRTISQLSGGEKTLTAVALLMAIFRSKPSCFCVLDEVDAALDEGNVGRFNGVVREFTDRSHFIVITHNKRTMASADQLYGVTMQERGVSKRVSVRFEQVGKNGEIRAGDTKADSKPAEPMTPVTPVVLAGAGTPANTPANTPAEVPAGSLRAALARMREHQQTVEN